MSLLEAGAARVPGTTRVAGADGVARVAAGAAGWVVRVAGRLYVGDGEVGAGRPLPPG